jgi:ferritin-like metal-binding protein YciE
VLPQLERDADSELLADPLAAHLAETRVHATRVEHVFVAAGAEPAAAASAALEGLRRQYAELAGAIVEPRLRDLFLVSAAAKTEHLEIALYAGLIPIARQIAVDVDPLELNLTEERNALSALEHAGTALLARTPS